MVACRFGCSDAANELLMNENNPPELYAVDSQGWTALHHASDCGSLDCLKMIVEKGFSISATTNKGETALHLAAAKDHFVIVDWLITAKNCSLESKTSFPDRNGQLQIRTALHLATLNGNLKTVKCLLQNEAEVDNTDQDGNTCLHFAAEVGNVKITEVLIKAGADINVKNGDGAFPQHLASYHGHLEVVKCIVNECQAKLNVEDNKGFTPIQLAASNKHTDVINCLLKGCLAKVNLEDNKGLIDPHLLSSKPNFNIDKECGAGDNWKREDGQTPLHLASREGHSDDVKRLVKDCQAHVNWKDENGLTPLHLASQYRHLDVVKCLVKECGAEVDLKRNDGLTALHCASIYGHSDVVECLVKECGADVNYKDKNGLTPFYLASQYGRLDVVQCLAKECGADVNVKRNDGMTSLHQACRNGHAHVVNYLVRECQADVNCKDETGWTPLHFASQYGHLDVVQCLAKECGADVDLKRKDGLTALHLASWKGHLDVVQCLTKELEADINLKDDDGWTPLQLASEHRRLDVVKWLVNECKADVNVKDYDGWTPLLLAIEHEHLDAILCLVNECKADVNLKDDNGLTPLHRASEARHLDVVKCLVIKCGADVNLKRNGGSTALQFASTNENLDVVICLVNECQADVNLENESGYTVLHLASSKGHLDVVKCLVSECFADVNLKDKYRNGHSDVNSGTYLNDNNGIHNTALHHASQNGHLQVTKFLVNECKADVNLQNQDGWTALHFATDRKHYEIVEFLLETQKADAKITTNGSTDMEGKSCFKMSVENEDFKMAYIFLQKAHILEEVQEFSFVSSEKENLIWVDFTLKNYKDKFSLLLKPEERDQSVMTYAASHGKLKSLLLMISFLINEKENEELKSIMGDILHCKNSEEMTLLDILISQGQPSRIFCQMLFTLEQEAHENIESFSQCVNLNLGPSKVAMEAIKSADNHYKLRNAADNENSKVNFSTKTYFWVKFLLTLALLPFILSVLDISTDCIQIIETWKTFTGSVNKTSEDYSDELASCNNTALEQLIETSQNIDDLFQLFFLIFFICLPLVLYGIEWYNNTSIGFGARFKEHNKTNDDKQKKTNDDKQNKSVSSSGNRERYLESNLILWWILQVFVIVFWPFVCIILKVSSNVEYSVKRINEKQKSYAKKMYETTSGEKAILSEVCTESSFQPLLQMYLLIPFLIYKIECSTVLSSSEGLKLLSILTSILALSFSFSSYIASKTNGAMPKRSEGFLLVMVQCALQITGRVLLLTFLGYCSKFFWAGLGFAILHIVIVFCVLKFLLRKPDNGTILLNAFANLYLQIGVSLPTNEKDVKSDRTTKITRPIFDRKNWENAIRGLFKVQPTFWIEPLILLENLLIAVTVWTKMRDNYIAVWSVSIGLLLYIGGLCLKLVYLMKVHIWRHLNSFECLIAIGEAETITQKLDEMEHKPITEDDEMELKPIIEHDGMEHKRETV